jgi:DinB superfamily
MNDTLHLRTAIIGLISFTAVEEELLLATIPYAAQDQGNPRSWAAAPLIAHNTEFKRQQVQRLEAIPRGQTPPAFAEIDHRSDDVYRRYSQQPADQVAQASREVTAALIDGLSATSDFDLLDPSRNPWLAGRQLSLQVIVRGFWHPMGHIGEYYIGHAEPTRAEAMQSHAVAAAEYLNAPAAARGMAYYNLACARAQAAVPGDAIGPLRQAIELNADLIANVRRDADLAALRDSGHLDAMLAS